MICKRTHIIRIVLILLLVTISVSRVYSEENKVDHFTGSLGFRLGMPLHFFRMPADLEPSVNWNLEPLFIQLYYYGFWFETDISFMPPVKRFWQNYSRIEKVAAHSNLPSAESISGNSRVSVTIYPFRMFSINGGITVGHLHHNVEWFRSDNTGTGETEYSRIRYQAFMFGLTWRFLERLRVAANIIVPYYAECTYRDISSLIPGILTHMVFEQEKPLPGASATFTAFLYKGLSLEVGYQFMVYNLSFERDLPGTSNNPFGQDLRIYSHRITFSVGYGFNLK